MVSIPNKLARVKSVDGSHPGSDRSGMGYGQQSKPPSLVKGSQKLREAIGIGFVEGSGWFIRQKKLGLVHQRSSDGGALLLTPGNFRRTMMHTM